jgi:hypothetical protein
MAKNPFPFILDELADLDPYTKPMFGCVSIYIGEKIMLIMRNRNSNPEDNGVWLATTPEHHAKLYSIFPSLRSIQLFGPGPTGWQIIPLDSPTFEEEVIQACQLIRMGSPLIGKIPKQKKRPSVAKANRRPKKKKPTSKR